MFFNSFLVIVGFFILFFILAIIYKNNSIVDIAWGIGFILVAFYNIIESEKIEAYDIVFLFMISLWAFRLAFHIFKRNFRKPEDFRYRKWREEWGRLFIVRSFFQIFILQAVLQLVISLPIIFIFESKKEISPIFFYIGGIIYLCGLVFETTADTQLTIFKKNPENKGKIITLGLWKYSRHPNYFGEFVIWVGIFIFSQGAKADMAGILSPILLYILLNYVSGVPMMEKKYAGRDDFEVYKKQTSVFFPWFKK